MERRRDRVSGAPVWFVDGRQDRPNQPATAACPFCPGGIEAPEPYDVRWFANRWPALPDGRCEVLLFSDDHEASLGSLGPQRVRRVVDLWVDRTVAQGGRDDVAYVLLFENRGAEVGATISHPHGQLYAFDEVPPVARRELDQLDCPICATLADGHEVTAAGGWRVVVPNAATWPFELLIAPAEHLPDLPSLGDGDRDALAACVNDGLRRLDALFDAPMPYMLWIHQKPSDGRPWPNAHVHVEVAPIWRAAGTSRYVAAGELGSGVFFNPLMPDVAAARLRTAL